MVSKAPKYYSTPELRFDCKDDDQKEQIMLEVFNYFSSKFEYSNIDGIRLKLKDGWALIRCSNTQPVIVCRMEAISEQLLVEYKSLVLDKLLSLGIEINENL
jgi:phosphomannomutase/phosphoglucomutase